MLKKILGILAAAILVLAVIIATRPDTFSYSSSVTINAPAEKLFPLVNNLHEWENWSPWAKLDPDMKKSYEGTEYGQGAVYKWAGNNQVGEGSTAIVESRSPDFIRMRLEFIKPFPGTNDVVFTFKPEGRQTVVTWAMSGKNNFMGKAFGLFMNCKKMCEDQFTKGLNQLKAQAEKA